MASNKITSTVFWVCPHVSACYITCPNFHKLIPVLSICLRDRLEMLCVQIPLDSVEIRSLIVCRTHFHNSRDVEAAVCGWACDLGRISFNWNFWWSFPHKQYIFSYNPNFMDKCSQYDFGWHFKAACRSVQRLYLVFLQ